MEEEEDIEEEFISEVASDTLPLKEKFESEISEELLL